METKITDRVLRDMRFLSWYSDGEDWEDKSSWRKAYKERHPTAYWDTSGVYALAIWCQTNSHSEYFLHISEGSKGLNRTEPKDWFCFLVNGQWSRNFIHLRHVKYFEELQEIVWAITRCRLFANETEMKAYCHSHQGEKREGGYIRKKF